MKLIIANKIPENTKFCPVEEGWKSLKEPKSVVVTMLISLPIGLLMSSIVIGIANLYGIKSDIIRGYILQESHGKIIIIGA